MIYFADRRLSIIGQASYTLPEGLMITDDLKTEDVETGTTTFECKIPFSEDTRGEVEDCAKCGNYILRNEDNENEIYTIIESETDTAKGEVYIYAEDAGLDLLNEIVMPYTATEAHSIAWYINYFANDTGFEIGVNEAESLSRKLSWDSEATITERLASVATRFDCELSYSFTVDKLQLTHKYINIYRERGSDNGVVLRLNYEVNSIIISKSIANLATALYATGGVPEGGENNITLVGYSYDDGDIYNENGYLKSREAVKKWSRYLNPTEPDQNYTGHILRTYTYDTTEQSVLCDHAVAELKKICDMEINYDVDITHLPAGTKIGDRVNIVDDSGNLYVSGRILQLKTSIAQGTRTATLGEYLMRNSGINQKVIDLAAAFSSYTTSNQQNINNIINAVDPLSKLLAVEIDTNTIMIPCDPDGYPEATLSVTVTVSGTKGGVATTAYSMAVSGAYNGISCVIDTSAKTLIFTVEATTAIAESNDYVLTCIDNETGQEIKKRITICGVRKGDNGDDGITSYVYIRYSANATGADMTEEPTEATRYIGICVTESSVAPTYYGSYTWSRYVGNDGQDGNDGVGIQNITEYYAVSASNSTIPTTWSTTVPEITNENKYLWIYETVTYTDSTTSNTQKRVIGVYGDKGLTGDVGVGIQSITNYYLATSANSGITTDTSGWTTTVQSVSSTAKYLWNYEVIEYTNGTNTATDPCIIGVYGDKGEQGEAGNDGTSSYMYIRYSANADGSDMTTTPQSNTKYIGLVTTSSATAPTDNTAYIWSEFTRKEDITATFIREQLNDGSTGLTHYRIDANALSIYGGAFAIYNADGGNRVFYVDNSGCLCLASPQSDMQLKLVNDRISFLSGEGDEVAFISSSSFHIRDGVIENSLRLGSFIFNPRLNGNLSLEWRE
ncbi:MAG TPA: phage tail protein [Firmicutes bacterium]|nr:phage tail protein [Bacillota bacterium]